VYFQKFSALGSNEIETQMAPDTIRDALYQRLKRESSEFETPLGKHVTL